ncbi:4-alpha-glucanotransferase [uncultured Gimesia sp.]|uniref:4-alpha-glucanotransferase n=1 Tax=uncultured Gimesia sp. TaxID=1678688 RepID=UPI0030D7E80E|tara:strand:- start:1394 stop:2989 length:1596 start_codon:yes stop_codon:yes gene_type:complete
MNNSSNPADRSFFSPNYRGAGVLLSVTSLPSSYGIGDFGSEARDWIDRLQAAGQSWWQILPLGPTGYGNSPYQPLSSFAVDWLLISPDDLVADGLLHKTDLSGMSFTESAVDFDAVRLFKQRLLEIVGSHFSERAASELKHAFETFCQEQKDWLDDYALFQALKDRHHGACYLEWPTEVVHRNPATLVKARQELANEMDQVRLAQFLVFRQLKRIKEYAHDRGVSFIGDLPFFVSPDSSDVWANPELFLLDDELRPRFVAGVPPDYFSDKGQFWGNPVYDWDALRQTGYRWCIDRIRALLAHVDLIRLDHFRGFAAAWHIPNGAPNARAGQWVPGPGHDFFSAVQNELGSLPLIAEDLGIITPDVTMLRDEFHLPGMRVLQFAFDGNSENPYLPHNYVSNTVVFTGTHDNNTTRGWYESLTKDQRKVVCESLQRPILKSREISAVLLDLAWSSVATLAVTPLQDVLNLRANARMNVPGRAGGNWRWRCTADMLFDPAFTWLRELTTNTNRLPVIQSVDKVSTNSEDLNEGS